MNVEPDRPNLIFHTVNIFGRSVVPFASHSIQCDRQVAYIIYSTLGHKLQKVGKIFCQILNKPAKNSQKLLTFCHTGHTGIVL